MTRLSKALVNTIEKYSNTINKIQKLESELKKLKEEKEVHTEIIKESFETNKPTETPFGTVTITTRRNWGEWPSDIQALDNEIKELKAKAKQVGTAHYEVIKVVNLK